MAAPITHIIIADKVFNKYFSNFDRNSFYIGTSFPDIRYLGAIDRATTHFMDEKVSLRILKQDNAFIAGAKFHAMVDIIRENYIITNKVYELLPKSKYIAQSLKLSEDELLYDKIGDWKKIINDSKNTPFEHINFGLEKEHIENWYSLLREYFSTKPNSKSRTKFITRVGFTEEDANEMNCFIDSAIKNKKIRQIVFDLYDRFESLLKEFTTKNTCQP